MTSDTNHTLLSVGDRIRLTHPWGWTTDYVVEEFRQCLGIFESEDHRTAGRFTPLCELYENGPNSEQKYISNFGEYITNQVAAWMNLPR